MLNMDGTHVGTKSSTTAHQSSKYKLEGAAQSRTGSALCLHSSLQCGDSPHQLQALEVPLEKMQLILNLNAKQFYLQFSVALYRLSVCGCNACCLKKKKKNVQRNLTCLSGLVHWRLRITHFFLSLVQQGWAAHLTLDTWEETLTS